MQTYRDHPLAFLCARPSVEGLRFRAADWRAKGHQADGMDVAGMFDHLVSTIERARRQIEGLLDRSGAYGQEGLAVSVGRIAIDGGLAEDAMGMARSLRTGMLDPYGGSVAASLEMAHEEILLLGDRLREMLDIANNGGSLEDIEALVLDALDRLPETAATHDAPRSRM